MTDVTPVSIAPASAAEGPIDPEKLDEALEYIRPAVQADGGDIVLLGADDGTVSLQMVGACGGCPLSMMTLKAGIERILKDRVPRLTKGRIECGTRTPPALVPRFASLCQSSFS
jgi:Fe-S cluster biogenesis protein NfuA